MDNLNQLYSDIVYVEDELGVYLYNLTPAELRIVARAASDLAELPNDIREDVYDQLAKELDNTTTTTGG